MFDVCVIGGGMVGSAMALGLGQLGFKVAIVEPAMPTPFDASQLPDMRVSAISVTSEKLLNDLKAWPYIQQMRLCPYKRLSVWDSPTCRTNFDCSAIAQPHLGHIIENRLVQLGLHKAITHENKITFFENLKVKHMTSSDVSTITLENDHVIQAKILVGADGGNSAVRDAVNIGVQGWQYSQQALGIKIKTTGIQQDITWQQFTANGPVAFLPLYDGFGSLVWYHNATHIRYLKGLSNAKLKQEVKQYFPEELIDFEVLDKASFPLTRLHAKQYFKGNTVLIGDAAHTINPLAGQGVNLGFKDVEALLAIIRNSLTNLEHDALLREENHVKCFRQYEDNRRPDNLLMMSAMDLLYSTFNNTSMPVKLLRNLGLKLAEHTGPIKNNAMKYAMGLA